MNDIYFRVDANKYIATGHLFRCLSIADAAKTYGINSVFIMSDDNCKELIEEQGYQVLSLKSDWKNPELELDRLNDIIKIKKMSLMIVDSYYVTNKYLKGVSKNVKVVYIDDLGVVEYPVFGLLCYSNYYKHFYYEKRFGKTNTQLFLGCDYVPLREQFYNTKEKAISKDIEHVLLLSGGSDEHHVIKHFLNVLSDKKNFVIEAICGRYNSEYKGLVEQYKNNNQIHIYQSVEHIEEYMRRADVAISAGGITLYELCACGTPTITYSMSDNQIDNVNSFAEEKIMPYLGDARKEPVWEKVYDTIIMNEDYNNRLELSKKMMLKVDGNGAKRFIESIIDCI